MILRLVVLMLQLLHDYLGRAVAHPAAGHMSVFDVNDGVLRVAAGHVVDDHLALVAELRRDARRDLLQRFQSSCLHNTLLFPFLLIHNTTPPTKSNDFF